MIELIVFIIIILFAMCLYFFQQYSTIKGDIETRAKELHEKWKQKDLNQLIKENNDIRDELRRQTESSIKDNEKQKEIAIRDFKNQMDQNKVELEKQKEIAIHDFRNQTEQAKIQLAEQAEKDARLMFEEWKQKEEINIRSDAINRSKSVIMGKATEHVIPFLPEFKYNPKDARWMGNPIDLLVFDGLAEGNLKRIIFIEGKTGKTCNLNNNERQVRDIIAVKKNRV